MSVPSESEKSPHNFEDGSISYELGDRAFHWAVSYLIDTLDQPFKDQAKTLFGEDDTVPTKRLLELLSTKYANPEQAIIEVATTCIEKIAAKATGHLLNNSKELTS